LYQPISINPDADCTELADSIDEAVANSEHGMVIFNCKDTSVNYTIQRLYRDNYSVIISTNPLTYNIFSNYEQVAGFITGHIFATLPEEYK
jgi:hypothetical protein